MAKLIVVRKALASDALGNSGGILKQQAYLDLATRPAERLWKAAYQAKTGELKHEIFRDRPQIQGYLDDYALLAIAFLSLADATHETVWRDRAAKSPTALQSRFFRDGMLATTEPATDLLIDPADDGDSTMPSGTSAAVELFARLHAATGQTTYATAVRRILSNVGSTIRDHPQVWASAVVALNRYPLPESAETKPPTAKAPLRAQPPALSRPG